MQYLTLDKYTLKAAFNDLQDEESVSFPKKKSLGLEITSFQVKKSGRVKCMISLVISA